MNPLEDLIANGEPIIALLAFIVLSLAAVIVYQWHYTTKQTVPKWVWDRLVDKIDELLKTQEKMSTIIKERLKK